ncbi:MAG: winged helix-turn-helix domain-containing protein [Deltaproteobacteria bacterium]|nr:winged helix-turn-helix domain-containing protein [Deltaproteobacteria bacterium]
MQCGRSELILDDRRVDLGRGEIVRGLEVTRLSRIEVRFLAFLARHSGEAVARDALWRGVWGGEPSPQSRAIDATARRVRAKLEPDPSRPRYLLSIYGEGFRLDLPQAPPGDEQPPSRLEEPVAPGARVLPVPPDPLIGRDALLTELAATLDGGHRLVTLVGPGGVGKTSLAVTFARARAAGDPRAVRFCDLATASSPEDVLSRIAAALDVRLGPATVEGSGPAALGAALAALGAVLIVLDNAEASAARAHEHVGALRPLAPDARFVATSRVPFRLPAERVVRVPPLGPAAAAALFVERARDAGGVSATSGGDTALATAAIVRRLDHLPLAIELAAARTALLTPAQLLDRLTARFDILKDPLGRRTPRHASLRAALDVSWELLSAVDRAALAQCAVFRGPFTVDAAEAVLALPAGGDVLDSLHRLIEHSLVANVPGPDRPRLRLLESTREYARERLGETPGVAEAARERHARRVGAAARHAVATIRVAGDAGELRAIGVEADNFRAVAAGPPGPDAVWAELALAVWSELHGLMDATFEACERALGAARALADDALVAECLLGLGACRYAFGIDVERGRDEIRAALDLARPGGDDLLVGRALLHLSACDFGSLAIEPLLDEAQERFARAGAGCGVARVHAFRSWHLSLVGDMAGSARENRETLPIFARLGPSRGHVMAKLSCASLALDGGDAEEAWLHVTAARAMAREIGYQLGEANATSLSAVIALERGDFPLARRLFTEELPLRSADGNGWYMMYSRAYRGLCALGEGAHGDGRADLDEAVRIARVRNDPQFLVRALAFRALLLREVAAEQAADDVREAITVAGADARPHVATLLAVVAQAIQETAPTGWSVEGHDDHADVRLCRRFAGPARR